MKTLKALSVALGLLIAGDGYVITSASAVPLPAKPVASSTTLVDQVRHYRSGGNMEWRRRHGGNYMRHRDYRPRREYYRHRYGDNNYGYRHHRRYRDRNVGIYLGVPFGLGLGYGYGGYGYGGYGYDDYYPGYNSVAEWCCRRYRTYNPRNWHVLHGLTLEGMPPPLRAHKNGRAQRPGHSILQR